VGSRLLAFTFLLLLFSFFSFPALAQTPGNGPPSQQPPNMPSVEPGPPMGNSEDAAAQMRDELAKKAEKERAEQLKLDTDKLLRLSVELKAYVDKTNNNVLSVDVMKKAEEIEKLAKSVHDKMRGPN
jgi:hypothetical protein